ncbi:Flp pilus assembly protein CpaB [Paenibacillus sp.]|uniref:Flp pilus assembly protein CpaB n=1 Tax=Paenibacillus sp. TaxID=58172 RepID=UPI002D5A9978|nr:Flp pilus assembly protein CpaB [Paenibacillus sp.]HZG58586.1 Flp pilus assembly protein CpaB [Paenibacillus sp.]
MRTKLVLALAIVMGMATTVLFYKYMSRFQAEAAVTEALVDVVVAAEPIARNERIGREQLTTARVPQLGLHESALTDPALAQGKLADANIAAGEPILSHRLKDEKDEALFVSRKVAEGKRAVSVGVNFVQTVSNLIEPEDVVDVLASRPGPDNKMTTELLYEGIRVLAVGRRMIESDEGDLYVEYSSVTLELDRDQAVRLVNADENGNIQFTLHSRVNREASASDGAAPAAE